MQPPSGWSGDHSYASCRRKGYLFSEATSKMEVSTLSCKVEGSAYPGLSTGGNGQCAIALTGQAYGLPQACVLERDDLLWCGNLFAVRIT